MTTNATPDRTNLRRIDSPPGILSQSELDLHIASVIALGDQFGNGQQRALIRRLGELADDLRALYP